MPIDFTVTSDKKTANRKFSKITTVAKFEEIVNSFVTHVGEDTEHFKDFKKANHSDSQYILFTDVSGNKVPAGELAGRMKVRIKNVKKSENPPLTNLGTVTDAIIGNDALKTAFGGAGCTAAVDTKYLDLMQRVQFKWGSEKEYNYMDFRENEIILVFFNDAVLTDVEAWADTIEELGQ